MGGEAHHAAEAARIDPVHPVDLENSEAGKKVLKAAVLTGIGKAEDKDYEPHRKMMSAVFGREVARR